MLCRDSKGDYAKLFIYTGKVTGLGIRSCGSLASVTHEGNECACSWGLPDMQVETPSDGLHHKLT